MRKKRRVNKAFVGRAKNNFEVWLRRKPWRGPKVERLADMTPEKRAEMERLYGPIKEGA